MPGNGGTMTTTCIRPCGECHNSEGRSVYSKLPEFASDFTAIFEARRRDGLRFSLFDGLFHYSLGVQVSGQDEERMASKFGSEV